MVHCQLNSFIYFILFLREMSVFGFFVPKIIKKIYLQLLQWIECFFLRTNSICLFLTFIHHNQITNLWSLKSTVFCFLLGSHELRLINRLTFCRQITVFIVSTRGSLACDVSVMPSCWLLTVSMGVQEERLLASCPTLPFLFTTNVYL